MPGKHINDYQVRRFMVYQKEHSISTAALKCGFSRASAYRVKANPQLPSQREVSRTWRLTRTRGVVKKQKA